MYHPLHCNLLTWSLRIGKSLAVPSSDGSCSASDVLEIGIHIRFCKGARQSCSLQRAAARQNTG